MKKLILLFFFLNVAFCSGQSEIQRTPKGEVITPRYDPSMRLTCEMRPEDYYPIINKPAMKKFEYTKIACYETSIITEANKMGQIGWQMIFMERDGNVFTCFFKREIIE